MNDLETRQRPWWKTWWARIIEVVGLLAAVVGLLTYFGIKPFDGPKVITPVVVSPTAVPRTQEQAKTSNRDEPEFTDAPAALKMNPNGTARNFVRTTDADFWRLFDGKTQNQTRVIIDSFRDKWVAISGTVFDVDTQDDGSTDVAIYGWKPISPVTENGVLSLFFDKKWKAALAYVHKNDVIKAVCRVSYEGSGEYFYDCERFDISDP